MRWLRTMLLLGTVSLSLLAVVASPLKQEGSADSGKLLEQAVAQHRGGDLAGAVKGYRSFLALHPEAADIHSNLGAALAQLGNYQDAIVEYQKALDLPGASAPSAIRFNLGLAHYKSAHFGAAAEALERVLSDQPQNLNAAIVLSDCYLQQGRYDRVVQVLSPFEEVAKGDPAFLYLLGTALIRDNQVEQGQRLVDQILRKGESAEAHLLLGTARLMIRDAPGALVELDQALKLNPRLPSLNSLYAKTLQQMGRQDEALTYYQRELEINPHDFDSNLYLGALLYKRDQKYEEALRYLEHALQVRPGDVAVRFQIGLVYMLTDRTEEALPMIEAVVSEAPDFLEGHVTLTSLYYKLRRREDAARHRAIVERLRAEQDATTVKEAVPRETKPRLCPECEPFQNDALEAYEAGDLEKAEGLLREAVSVTPGWAAGWWHLGSLYYEASRFADGRRAFQRFTEVQAHSGSGWGMLGLCEFKEKDFVRALRDLTRAMGLGFEGNEELRFSVSYHAALALTRFQQYEEAFSILAGLCLNYADNPKLQDALGLASLRLPFLPEEVPADWRPAVELAGEAASLAASNRYEEARVKYAELAQRFGDLPNVHFARALFFLVSDPDAALEEFLRELKVSPQHFAGRVQLALEYVKRGDPQSAVPYAEEAVGLEPKSFGARYALGMALLDGNRVEEALGALETARELNPSNPQVHFLLAKAYAKSGKLDEAKRSREEFLKLDRKPLQQD